MNNLLRSLFFTAASALSMVPGIRAAEDPMAFLKEGVDEVLAIVYDGGESHVLLSERLQPVLEKRFDLAAITRRAVGRPWLKFSPQEREKAIELFGTLVLRTYADRFEPQSRPTIEYGKPVKLSETNWELPTTVVYEGNSYSVAYRVQHGKSGWRIYDVVIEGVSMVSNYRAQFDAIIQKGGAAALLEALAKNIAEGKAAS